MRATGDAMPEKGWVNLTVRKETKDLLKREAAKMGISIDAYIKTLLTSQIIIKCIKELTSQEENIINKVKRYVHEKAGTIKYKCECGEVIEYLDLILTNGKCPKCGKLLVKFNLT